MRVKGGGRGQRNALSDLPSTADVAARSPRGHAPSQVVRPGARSVFREVTLGTDSNEASAPELFSAARPEDRSGDAVKIWNHTQVAMRGKRIIGAPRG